MNSSADLTRDVIQALGQLPGVTVRTTDCEVLPPQPPFDAVVQAEVKGQTVLFLIESKTSGTPYAVKRAIEQLEVHCQAWTASSVPIIATHALSRNSRELLQQHHIGYWDTGGSIYVDLPWALYWIDRPIPPAPERILHNPYRGSAAEVLHALLIEPGTAWHISTLADRAQVSVSTAHQVCSFLEEQLWMEKEGRGPRATRILREPAALLDAWADAHSLAIYAPQRFHRWAPNPLLLHEAVTNALQGGGIQHALTLSSGADLVAPHGTETDHVWLLVPATQSARLDKAAEAANLRRVEDGENVTILVTRERSPLLFWREVGSFSVVSDIQLYLDLWAWPRRGKEQARHLRRERISY